MITHSFAEEAINKIKNIHIFILFTFMTFIGININTFEEYPNFKVLFPVLLFMSFSTIVLLKYCFKKCWSLMRNAKI